MSLTILKLHGRTTVGVREFSSPHGDGKCFATWRQGKKCTVCSVARDGLSDVDRHTHTHTSSIIKYIACKSVFVRYRVIITNITHTHDLISSLVR